MVHRGRWLGFVALSATTAFALSGCAGAEPPPGPEPSATETAEQAELELARTILRDFTSLSSEALSTGNVPEALGTVATQPVIDSVASDVAIFASDGYVLMGEFAIDSVAVVSEVGADPLVAIACVDSTGSAVEDANGDRVPGGSVSRQAVVAEIVDQDGQPRIDLFVYEILPNGGDPCAR